jgi:murein peptide amidase A
MVDAAAAPPSLILRLGRSEQGRPMIAVRVGPAHARVRIVVVGCIHGNEPAGIQVTQRLRELRPPPGTSVFLIDTLNPDGLGVGTRQDARGVDLNRNFPGTWRPLGHPGTLHYSGPRAASERETRIAVHFLRALRPAVTIWYHQALGLVDRSGGSVAVERDYARRVGLPLRTIPPQPGEATRWQNMTFAGTTSFVVELPPGPLSTSATARHAAAVLALARSARA